MMALHVHSGFILVAVIISLSVQSGACLSCVRCFSYHEPRCYKGDLAPKPCSTNQTHCVKYEAKHKDMPSDFVNRDCYRGDDVKPHCTVQKHDGKNIQVCSDFCDYDGCNSAPTTHCSGAFIALLASLITSSPYLFNYVHR
ncbi:uncharacterized protein LOC128224478 [Mya arenaria]|uniref:uncharacterized protein LOC128224478 n=1 Tax=Mya arenaria TaxID=6604 RepID=UPI0022DEE114|nr:uncharacterized protein LOC128224478 [Mya arenaria]